MSERRPVVAANWKMHKKVGESEAFLDRFLPASGELDEIEVVVCPPYLSLQSAVERCRRSTVRVAAQNMHEEESGAFTGEVSAAMLLDIGVGGAILGHSERRALFGETDEALARKLPAALAAGLQPILCVGESEEQRDTGETESVLEAQIKADLAAVATADLPRLVVAYEPIWAIGTGRTASSDQAEEACAHIRSLLAQRDRDAAGAIRVLYGGSVKPANAGELMALANVDGALVGGAALDPADFLAICEAAAP